MWESLMRLTVLSSEACEERSGFLCCRCIVVTISAAEDDEGGRSLLASLDAILGLQSSVTFTKRRTHQNAKLFFEVKLFKIERLSSLLPPPLSEMPLRRSVPNSARPRWWLYLPKLSAEEDFSSGCPPASTVPARPAPRREDCGL